MHLMIMTKTVIAMGTIMPSCSTRSHVLYKMRQLSQGSRSYWTASTLLMYFRMEGF